MTPKQLIEDVRSTEFNIDDLIVDNKPFPTSSVKEHVLPDDCINLFDSKQVEYYRDNTIVQACMSVIKERRLDTACNRPLALYVSLTDFVHKNRLVIPFYDVSGKIIYYQTRGVLHEDLQDRPKYLSKSGGTKSLYGIHNMDIFHDNVYLTEGPIDAFFIINGLALCGIQENNARNFNDLQASQLNYLHQYSKVWCINNQWVDKAAYNKTLSLIDQGETVFIWPETFKRFKDFNELCIRLQQDCIPHTFLQNNTCAGLKAQVLMKQISGKTIF